MFFSNPGATGPLAEGAAPAHRGRDSRSCRAVAELLVASAACALVVAITLLRDPPHTHRCSTRDEYATFASVAAAQEVFHSFEGDYASGAKDGKDP